MKTTGKVLRSTAVQSLHKPEKVMFPAYETSQSSSAIETKTRTRPQTELTTADMAHEHQNGFRAGYQQGLAKGQDDGYQAGLAQGIEEGRTQGYEDGLKKGEAEGLKQGYQTGMARSREDAEYLATQMNNQLACIDHLSRQHRQQISKLVADVIETTVRHVTRIEMRNRPEHVRRVVEDMLEQLPNNHGSYQIHLNPIDAERLIQLHPELRNKWSIVAAPEVAPGDCRIASEHSQAESSHQQRMDDCLEQVCLHLPAELEKILS